MKEALKILKIEPKSSKKTLRIHKNSNHCLKKYNNLQTDFILFIKFIIIYYYI